VKDEIKPPTSTGFSENTSAIICFVPILGVLPAIAFVLLEKNKIVKLYALQSVLLWATVVIADTLLQVSFFAAKLISLVNIVGLIIVPLVIAIKISQKENIRIPFLVDLAEKFLASTTK
jgi:uncharacterized membrane protein